MSGRDRGADAACCRVSYLPLNTHQVSIEPHTVHRDEDDAALLWVAQKRVTMYGILPLHLKNALFVCYKTM